MSTYQRVRPEMQNNVYFSKSVQWAYSARNFYYFDLRRALKKKQQQQQQLIGSAMYSHFLTCLHVSDYREFLELFKTLKDNSL